MHLRASDDVDLFGFAKESGYRVMQDRAGFDELQNGTAEAAALPYIGLFNDGRHLIPSAHRTCPLSC